MVIDEIAAERRRQIEVEGFSAAHDDRHAEGELAEAAACYAVRRLNARWPWDLEWWKPKGIRRNLIKAAALIIAEIERLDRAAANEAEKATNLFNQDGSMRIGRG
jgi:hypothetical protein